MTLNNFEPFPKLYRLSREIIITEKLDGTNAQIFISEDGEIKAGSRTRYISLENDNFEFARWVEDNKEELLQLGPGRHFGEWWGSGIQRGYGLKNRVFSLFNTSRWEENRPSCCSVVPVLYKGSFSTSVVDSALEVLDSMGSAAAPGFMKPEGVVVFHTASNTCFKKTLHGDGHKGLPLVKEEPHLVTEPEDSECQ